MTVECWSTWHLQHALPLGIPLLFVSILLPSLPAMLLHKYRSQLEAGNMPPDVCKKLGFIYKSYE